MTTTVDALPALLALVERAGLAPSALNTQPWRWVVRTDGDLELVADAERSLGQADPGGRELVMSCGAALLTLRVAAAHARLGTRVVVLPDPGRPDVLARIGFDTEPVDVVFADLDAVVPLRRTWRGPMRAGSVPEDVRVRLAAEARAEGTLLVEIPLPQRDTVARLVAAADAGLGLDARWRAERARWVRPAWSREGVPAGPLTALPARLAVRYLDLGGRAGAHDAALVRAAPMLAVLATPTEDRAAWLAAGQALQRVLLVAAARGLAVGLTNSACEDPDRRPALGALLGSGLHPQAVLRLGTADRRAVLRRRPPRRRRVEDLVDVVGDGPARPLRRGRPKHLPVKLAPVDPAPDGDEDAYG